MQKKDEQQLVEYFKRTRKDYPFEKVTNKAYIYQGKINIEKVQQFDSKEYHNRLLSPRKDYLKPSVHSCDGSHHPVGHPGELYAVPGRTWAVRHVITGSTLS